MTGPALVPPKWRKPAPLGYGNAIDSVGTVGSSLLAGFSPSEADLGGHEQSQLHGKWATRAKPQRLLNYPDAVDRSLSP